MGFGKHGGGGSHGGHHVGGGGGSSHHSSSNHHHASSTNNAFVLFNSHPSNNRPHSYNHNYSLLNVSSVPSCHFNPGSCCGFFIVLAFLFFLFSMTPSTTFITMDVGETRLYSNLNSLLDQGIAFRDLTGNSIKVYHLNHRPPMTMETTPTLLQDTRVIDNDAYNYFTYYLNHGSVIKMDFSSDIDTNLLLFRGATAFDMWIKNPDSKSSNLILTKFSTSNKKISFVYTVSASDDYILVLDNYDKSLDISATISFSLVLLRNNYDVSSEIPLCDYPHHVYPPPATDTSTDLCYAPLNMIGETFRFFILTTPTQKVATVGGDGTTTDAAETDGYDVEILTDPRWWMWGVLGMILFVPSCCVMIVCCIGDSDMGGLKLDQNMLSLQPVVSPPPPPPPPIAHAYYPSNVQSSLLETTHHYYPQPQVTSYGATTNTITSTTTSIVTTNPLNTNPSTSATTMLPPSAPLLPSNLQY